jgi:acyl-CoA synthetase (AMP-forming)/AMP-acid ligase II
VALLPASIVRRSARIYRDHPAVRFEGREQTYAQLHGRACRLVNVLRGLDVRPQQAVALLADNAFESVEQSAACALGNFIRTTLFTYNAPAVNRYLLELTGAVVLIVQAAHRDAIASWLRDLPALRHVIVFDGPAAGAIDYETALASASADDVAGPDDPESIHMIRFSSGTTGRPKGIYHSNALWMAYNHEWRWVTPPLTERSRYLSMTSLNHLGLAFVWGVLATGGCILPMRTFAAPTALELLEGQRVTHAVAAPVMLRDMLRLGEARSRNFSALQCLVYAGSPIAEDTLRAAVDVFGPSLHQMYGQSEVAPVTMLMPHDHVVGGTPLQQRRMRSVGRATPTSRVTIVDDEGRELAAGEVGEIAALAPPMSGLWKDPAGTAARLLPDGSILTRDMGWMDEDGYVYLVDRKDDMIVSGGYNLWPAEIEQAFASHPAVADVSVFGVPDERWGETPKAAVVLREGHHASADELLAHCRAVVGGVKKATSVELVASLPRNAAGKVLRHVLREPYWVGRASRVAGS